MQPSEFTSQMGRLTTAEFAAIGAALRAEHNTADGEVAWWRATMAVNAALRRQRRTREAGLAAHHASAAVLDAARLCGAMDEDRDTVTAVARAASDVARALVAGHNSGDVLYAPFRPLAYAAA
jgi:hypothetical protein